MTRRYIFFSNYDNLQSVYFEFEMLIRSRKDTEGLALRRDIVFLYYIVISVI